MYDSSYYTFLRFSLHQHPDPSGCEQFAHDLVVHHLHQLHPDALYDHVGGFGVVAYWKPTQQSSSETPSLAFRADTDALPIGHRCGHDGHTTILLRFAQSVALSNSRQYGTLLIFQPEEETGNGARKIVDSGLMQQHNVVAVFGLHNIPGYPLGMPLLIRNTFAAASCGVRYKLTGRTTHASTPEKGINPGLAVADIIYGFNGLNRTGSDALFRQSTLICCRLGEEAFGTSAGEGEVMFTLRTYSNNSMDELLSDADHVVSNAAQQYGLEMQKSLQEPFAATENTPELVDKLFHLLTDANRQSPSTILYPPQILSTPFRWSEDFAEYLKHYPGTFFGIGSGSHQPELHNPSYNFPDALIQPAATIFETIMKNLVISDQ